MLLLSAKQILRVIVLTLCDNFWSFGFSLFVTKIQYFAKRHLFITKKWHLERDLILSRIGAQLWEVRILVASTTN